MGNFSLNPQFVSTATDNYHLKQESPCIDRGNPVSDYSNEPGNGGGRINVGAYGNTEEAAVIIDVDEDGLPDVWQLAYWQDDDPNNPDPNWAPDGDPDTDDLKNIVEYQTRAATLLILIR